MAPVQRRSLASSREVFLRVTAVSRDGVHGARAVRFDLRHGLFRVADEPQFLEGADGVFTENWQSIASGPGDWNLSARRICRYATAQAKVWLSDVTAEATALPQAERELLIGTYLLLRNGTSYLMFGGGITW